MTDEKPPIRLKNVRLSYPNIPRDHVEILASKPGPYRFEIPFDESWKHLLVAAAVRDKLARTAQEYAAMSAECHREAFRHLAARRLQAAAFHQDMARATAQMAMAARFQLLDMR